MNKGDLVERLRELGAIDRTLLIVPHSLLTQAADEIARLREALETIAASRFGLQGIAEDHSADDNAYNYHAMQYWASQRRRDQSLALAALQHKEPQG